MQIHLLSPSQSNIPCSFASILPIESLVMFNIIQKYPILSHILFWTSVLLLDVLEGDSRHEFYSNLTFGICNIVAQMIASYFTVYYLIPRFYQKKKYILLALWFIISAYLISVFARILVVHVGEPLVRTPPFDQESILEIFADIRWLLLQYFPSIYIMAGFFWLITFLDFRRKDLTMQKEKTAAELKMLKSQLNPHFLFNTLNNIYSLSLYNSPKTSESIGKLSDILDYVLYRCDDKFVPLSGELKMIEDYISLEKLRYDNRLKVTLEKNLETHPDIAPLILLSLVENAFKHGAGEDGGSPNIDIKIDSTDRIFRFSISNSVVDAKIEKTKDSIGLENIRKQLSLIYPNRYNLDITRKDNSFNVILELYF